MTGSALHLCEAWQNSNKLATQKNSNSLELSTCMTGSLTAGMRSSKGSVMIANPLA